MNSKNSNKTQDAEGSEDAPVHVVTRETIESIVVAFLLAFVFRTYILEPFIIPTGSMAPTLLGQHHAFECSQCGYQFDVNATDSDQAYPSLMNGLSCPMCTNKMRVKTDVYSGDRILVNKFAYHFGKPKRWDVVVFKAPHKPYINFIKRLVGLPGEDLMVVAGNIYVRSNGEIEPKSKWRIARKTDPEENKHAFAIQRAVWQPVYHSRYKPEEPGLVLNWQTPWSSRNGSDASNWHFEAEDGYRFKGDIASEISFDFRTDERMMAPWFTYNLSSGDLESHLLPDLFLEDIRLACTFNFNQNCGVRLKTTGYAFNDADAVRCDLVAEISETGVAQLYRHKPGQDKELLVEKALENWRVNRDYDLELWWVDQQLSLWVDQQRVVSWEVNFDEEVFTSIKRHGLPDIRIEMLPGEKGVEGELANVKVDRDLIYTTFDKRQGVFTHQIARPVALNQDQYFCMGDNSPNSSDSRDWSHVDGWLSAHVDQMTGQRLTPGVVPASVMMGQAFAVYFPGVNPGGRFYNRDWHEVRLIR